MDKLKSPRYILPVLTVILGLFLAVTGLVKAGLVQGFWDLVAEKTASKLAGQVESSALGAGESALLGTAINTGTESNFNCTGLKDDDSARTLVDCFSSADFPSTGNVVPIVTILSNNLGAGTNIIVDRADISAVGSVSSTLQMAIYATSTAASSLPYNQPINVAALGTTSTLFYRTMVTSTSMVFLDSLDEVENNNASSTVQVLPRQNLVLELLNPYNNGCIIGTSKCEAVTSTFRGFTEAKVNVRFHYYRNF